MKYDHNAALNLLANGISICVRRSPLTVRGRQIIDRIISPSESVWFPEGHDYDEMFILTRVPEGLKITNSPSQEVLDEMEEAHMPMGDMSAVYDVVIRNLNKDQNIIDQLVGEQNLKRLVREFFEILDTREETDSGREFSPVTISSCRVLLSERMGEILSKMRNLL